MMLSVADAAHELGVSERRVLAMLHSGELKGEKLGGRWILDARSVQRPKRHGRPMSPRNAWALILQKQDWLDPQAAWKLRSRRARLGERDAPELVLASWLRGRGERLELSAPRTETLLDDPRVVPGGVSDPRAQMAVSDLVEMYVHANEASGFMADHWLVPAKGAPNVVLHVVPILPPEPVPILLLVTDLVDHGSERDLRRARELLRDVV